MTYYVEITFKNGSQTHFYAQEFDIEIPDIGAYAHQVHPDFPHRFTYKGSNGQETPIYLTMGEVAGIVVAEYHG